MPPQPRALRRARGPNAARVLSPATPLLRLILRLPSSPSRFGCVPVLTWLLLALLLLDIVFCVLVCVVAPLGAALIWWAAALTVLAFVCPLAVQLAKIGDGDIQQRRKAVTNATSVIGRIRLLQQLQALNMQRWTQLVMQSRAAILGQAMQAVAER